MADDLGYTRKRKKVAGATPVAAPKPEDTSNKHPLISGGIRVAGSFASGILNKEPGLGSLAAAGVGGVSELLAEMAEEGSITKPFEDPVTLAERVGTEAALSAIPGSKYFGSTALKSAARSGLIGGVGEGARELAKTGDIDPKSIARSTVLSGVTGGVLGALMPNAVQSKATAAVPVVAKTMKDLATEHAQDAAKFGEAAHAAMVGKGWTIDKVAKEAADLEAAGMGEHANALRDASMRTKQWVGKSLEAQIARLEAMGQGEAAQAMRRAAAREDVGTTGMYERTRALDARANAAKQARDEAARKAAAARAEFDRIAQQAGAKERAQQSIGAVDPNTGERVTHTVTVTPKSEKDEGDELLDELLGGAGSKPPRGGKGGGRRSPAPTTPVPAAAAPIVEAAGAAPNSVLKTQIEKILDELMPGARGVAAEEPAAAQTASAGLPVAPEAPNPGIPEVPPVQTEHAVIGAPEPPRVRQEPRGAAPRVDEDIMQSQAIQALIDRTHQMHLNELPDASTIPGVRPITADEEISDLLPQAAHVAPVEPEVPATVAPTPAPAPAAPIVAAPSAPPPVATPKRGSPGDVKIGDMLSGDEKGQAAVKVIEAQMPKYLSEKLKPLAIQYNKLAEQIALGEASPAQLKVLKSQKGNIGMEMKLLTNQAEAAGAIPAGHGEAVSKMIREAIEDANAEKFASTIKVGPATAEPPSSTPIFAMEPPMEGPLPSAGPSAARKAELDALQEKMQGVDLTSNPEATVESATTRAMSNAPEGEGTVLGSGLGGMQAIAGLVSKQPEFAKRLAGGVIGGVAGAVTDPFDDPITSIAAGAGVGLAAPDILSGISKLGVKPSQVPNLAKTLESETPEAKAVAQTAWHLLPAYQRFSYLSSLPGMGANIFAGPYGSMFFGALARGMAGDKRGWEVVRRSLSSEWAQEFLREIPNAKQMIVRAGPQELGRAEMSGLSQIKGGRWLQGPAVGMAAGDAASRKILMSAGFSEQEAREMTLTSELYLPLFKKILNLTRGERSVVMETMFPFVKTPLNIAEQAAIRFPGLGFIAQNIREKNGAPVMSKSVQLAQQGLGLILGMGGYVIGSMVDPNDKSNLSVISRVMTNSAGPYSGLAALGFAAAQASAQGKSGLKAMGSEFTKNIPLPTFQPINEAWNLVNKTIDEGPGAIGVDDLPRGMIPAVFREPLPYGAATPPLPPELQGLEVDEGQLLKDAIPKMPSATDFSYAKKPRRKR